MFEKFKKNKDAHSREAVEQAEKDVVEATESLNNVHKRFKAVDRYGPGSYWINIGEPHNLFHLRLGHRPYKPDTSYNEKISNEALEHFLDAERKLADLIDSGHKEAQKLNAEYNRLNDEVEQAHAEFMAKVAEVDKFETEQLGMVKEPNLSGAEEAV